MKRIILVLIAIIALAAGLMYGRKAYTWLAIDSCLDGGGACDYSRQACRYK